MDIVRLNRCIGLAMNALKKARATKQRESIVEMFRSAVKLLNKARALLKANNVFAARLHASVAYADIKTANRLVRA